ncbi:MAG: hypothetical protein NC131_01060 [Roseburia sp.]|nr:hypothetical protein [Roseburia sp.]
MVITVYDKILKALKEYNETLEQNYGNVVVGTSPSTPTYPLTVFDEIRNDPLTRTNIRPLDRVDNLGYELEIYAKTKGSVNKQTIARKIAKELDDFLTERIGLQQLSMNPVPNVNDSSIYRINIRYSAKYFENRAKIL